MIAPAMHDSADTVLGDRRRPGRPATVSRALLPLLRAEERALLPSLADQDVTEDRRLIGAGQGVVLGMLIGSALWGAILGLGWAVAQLF